MKSEYKTCELGQKRKYVTLEEYKNKNDTDEVNLHEKNEV